MLGRLLIVALPALRRRALRSLLVVLTVAVGIAAVVATAALTNGLKQHVAANTAKAGRLVSVVHRDMLQGVTAQSSEKTKNLRTDVTYGDLAEMAAARPAVRVHHADAPTEDLRVGFIPAEIGYAAVDAGGREPARIVLVGTTPAYRHTIGYGLIAGRFLERDDLVLERPVCVLDTGAARRFYGSGVSLAACVGRELVVRFGGTDLRLEVVGVLKEPFLLRERFKSFDTVRLARPAILERLNLMNLYAPITLVTERPDPGGEAAILGGVRFRRVRPVSGLFIDYGAAGLADVQAYEESLRTWAEDQGLALWVLPQWLWLQKIEELLGSADLVGGAIWFVILGVTVVMILVINLVVVRERFREVAIRRTEGARRVDILVQFLAESCVLALLGGLLGALGGVVAAEVLSERVTGWPAVVTPGSMLLAAGAALAVGVLSTLLPAWHAARLDPVKVLCKP